MELIYSNIIGSYSLCGTVDSCFWWVSKLSMEMTGWPWAFVITLANIGCDLSRLEALAVCTWTCIPVFNDWVTTANNKHKSYKLMSMRDTETPKTTTLQNSTLFIWNEIVSWLLTRVKQIWIEMCFLQHYLIWLMYLYVIINLCMAFNWSIIISKTQEHSNYFID